MNAESAVLAELKKMVGRQMTITSPEEIGRSGIRAFAQAQGDLNPLYLDEEFALGTRYGGIIAPPTLVCETLQYMVGELDETGGAAGRFGLSVGMEIRAANDYEFFQPLRPDDVLTAHWKVTNVREKQGRTGTLYFLEYDITYTNQRDEMLAVNHETLIFRDEGTRDG